MEAVHFLRSQFCHIVEVHDDVHFAENPFGGRNIQLQVLLEAGIASELKEELQARERDEARHKKDVEEIKSMSASQVTWSDFRIAFPSNANWFHLDGLDECNTFAFKGHHCDLNSFP